MILELKPFWRCTGCGKEISTCGTQTAASMEAFSWRDSTMSHWCKAGQVTKPCELVVLLNTDELTALYKSIVTNPTITTPKRGPGRPPKVEAKA